jgi:hypothetical protein
MTRIASKFGIAAALTLGLVSAAAAQGRTTTSTKTVPVGGKETSTSTGEVVTVHDTVMVHDTVTTTVYRRDTITVTGPTITRYDTTTVEVTPGWLNRGNGLYFGLGAGAYYPSAALGAGQIPGYAFQANLGVDPAGSPLGLRLTAQLARPDEAQGLGAGAARPTVWNATGDLKLRIPFFGGSRFPQVGLYAVGGGAYVRYQALRMEQEDGNVSIETPTDSYHDKWGWNAGGGATMQMGHKRELFLEARVINFQASGYENSHQLPIILGINWY